MARPENHSTVSFRMRLAAACPTLDMQVLGVAYDWAELCDRYGRQPLQGQ